ncbi:hypothetical protein C475_20632 [Halosimplex carlsbadense 2-9-1]|uniref:DUF3194 domain-containing protein n=1 Tax=Halosimplex carlsbadense 2-9-1 TaxID=797114 RepID=M0CC57_9EURY|nr:DUF3194 domain-containing protein [Halosimplex carlsbadense]ELZ20218.1 hypothetical protein C475_20632 [Halosimplex carlsbadense 2-9-1]
MPTDDAAADGGTDAGADDPSDQEVVEAAAEAADRVVFSRLDRSAVDDLDVTVTFEDGILEVDVYLNAPDASGDPDRVADDAALAARGAVDDLFA